MCVICFLFFFFKQKTAYEMRISDWSSDVCSSDLTACPASSHLERPRERRAASQEKLSSGGEGLVIDRGEVAPGCGCRGSRASVRAVAPGAIVDVSGAGNGALAVIGDEVVDVCVGAGARGVAPRGDDELMGAGAQAACGEENLLRLSRGGVRVNYDRPAAVGPISVAHLHVGAPVQRIFCTNPGHGSPGE